jgi:hypothetical protein
MRWLPCSSGEKQRQLDTANCCEQRTLYQRKQQFLIANYDSRLARV